MKLVYNKSANFIESYAVHFNINGPSNFTRMVPVIGMKGVVSHPCFCDKRDFLMLNICSIKSTAVEKWV